MIDYNFSTFQEFFEYNFQKHCVNGNGKKDITLIELSKKIGYNSPSLLSIIANGKRLPSTDVLEALFDEWKIDNNLREIIRIRLEIEKRIKKNKSASSLIEKLSRIDKKKKYVTIQLEKFNAIKEWYNLVLQMLVMTPAFKEDYLLISQLLKKKITPSQVKKGYETLIKSGLLKRNVITGELESRFADKSVETTHDIPSEAIREHHRGMIYRALEAIGEQSVDQRHINSLTLQFEEIDMGDAKAAILNFVKDFNSRFYKNNSNNIYQLNVQFFSHTDSLSEIAIKKE